jgi:hypothetical protein
LDIDEENWIIDDSEPIEIIRKKRSYSPSHKIPGRKRRYTTIDNEPSSSNDIENLINDNFDLLIPFQKDPPISSLQIMTPKSTLRSRQPSTASSINTTIVLSPPILHETNTRIIRCLANTSNRITEDKKLRIPM